MRTALLLPGTLLLSGLMSVSASAKDLPKHRTVRDDDYQHHNPHQPAVMYLPLGGGPGTNECDPAAGAKLAQLVPLLFAGMTFTIFDAVATIANNINSNNNNNNNVNLNFQESSNTVVTGNINVANQINVMNVAGRKRRAATAKKRMAEVARKGLEAMAALNDPLVDEAALVKAVRLAGFSISSMHGLLKHR